MLLANTIDAEARVAAMAEPARPMRILIVALNYAPELVGCAKYTSELAEDLARRGHQVDVVTSPPYYPGWSIEPGYSGARWNRERLNGVTVHRTPLYVPARPAGLKRLAHLASFGAAALPTAVAVARRRRPHLVFAVAPTLAAAGAALVAAKMSGARACDWVAPYWAPRLTKMVQIGTHIFYRWNGAWGLPSAFTGVYAGIEPVIPKMAALSTMTAETPVEILVSEESSFGQLIETAAPRLSPLLPKTQDPVAWDTEPTETAAAAAVVVATRPEPVLQRDVPIMADPMVNPAAPPARQRQRIAAPSGW